MKILRRRVDGIRQGYHVKSKSPNMPMVVLRTKLSTIQTFLDRMDEKFPGDTLYSTPMKDLEPNATVVDTSKKVLKAYPYVFNLFDFITEMKGNIYYLEANGIRIKDDRIVIYIPKHLADVLAKAKLFYRKGNIIFDDMGNFPDFVSSEDSVNLEYKKYFKYYISKELYDMTDIKHCKVIDVGVLK